MAAGMAVVGLVRVAVVADWEVVVTAEALGVATVAVRVASAVATQEVAERGWAVAERVVAGRRH